MANPIDNFLITLQNTAGYMTKGVVCLWYSKKPEISKERTEIYGNKKTIDERKRI